MGLQAKNGKFQNPGKGYGFVVATGIEKTDFRKSFAQAFFETGKGVQRTLIFTAGDDGLDRCIASPQIGATQGPDA